MFELAAPGMRLAPIRDEEDEVVKAKAESSRRRHRGGGRQQGHGVGGHPPPALYYRDIKTSHPENCSAWSLERMGDGGPGAEFTTSRVGDLRRRARSG